MFVLHKWLLEMFQSLNKNIVINLQSSLLIYTGCPILYIFDSQISRYYVILKKK